jgi:hypothetical protein
MRKLFRIKVTSLFLILPFSIIIGHVNTGNQSDVSTIDSKHIRYFNASEINFGIGFGDSNRHSSVGIHFVNGILINSDISLGIGLGLDRLSIAKNLNEITPSISIDVRYYFLNRYYFLKDPILLYFACDGGYVYNLTGYNLGYRTEGYGIDLSGLYINPSLGSKILVFKNKSINLSIGVKIQETTINYVSMILPKYEHLINFKAGFSF